MLISKLYHDATFCYCNLRNSFWLNLLSTYRWVTLQWILFLQLHINCNSLSTSNGAIELCDCLCLCHYHQVSYRCFLIQSIYILYFSLYIGSLQWQAWWYPLLNAGILHSWSCWCLSSMICLWRIISDFYLTSFNHVWNLFRKISCAVLYSFESTLKLLAHTYIIFHDITNWDHLLLVVKRKI